MVDDLDGVWETVDHWMKMSGDFRKSVWWAASTYWVLQDDGTVEVHEPDGRVTIHQPGEGGSGGEAE